MVLLNMTALIVLILLTAFFVAAEFSIVKVRKAKLDALAGQGNHRAKDAKKVVDKLDEYLSACQLGITMTALGIGWLGEPAVGRLLEHLFGYFPLSEAASVTIATVTAFIIITILHVVLGELAPKTFAIQKAEVISLRIARPLIRFNQIMYPFIWLLNGSANIISRFFGARPVNEEDNAHTEEELRHLLSESYERGEINQSEYRYVNRIFEFDDRLAKEIMIPRTEIVCLYCNLSIEANLDIMKRDKFTRYPVVEQDKDHIIGIINIKELFHSKNQMDGGLRRFLRSTISVIDSTPIKQLLVKMQRDRVHMAVLLDEYGGTSGIVTVEDILEEIVGEIRDEFDVDEKPMFRKIKDDVYRVDGKVLLTELSELFHVNLNSDEIDTVGGFILTKEPDVSEGSIIKTNGLIFETIQVEGLRVKEVEVRKNTSAS